MLAKHFSFEITCRRSVLRRYRCQHYTDCCDYKILSDDGPNRMDLPVFAAPSWVVGIPFVWSTIASYYTTRFQRNVASHDTALKALWDVRRGQRQRSVREFQFMMNLDVFLRAVGRKVRSTGRPSNGSEATPTQTTTTTVRGPLVAPTSRRQTAHRPAEVVFVRGPWQPQENIAHVTTDRGPLPCAASHCEGGLKGITIAR